MPHAKPGMPALLDIRRRTTEPVDQKITEPLLSAMKIVRRIKRAQNVVIRYLPVERGNQPLKSSRADGWVDLVFFHYNYS